jgi:hypothetical protein
MCIYGMWPWKVAKWPWFWAEVAVKAWRDLATLILQKLSKVVVSAVHVIDAVKDTMSATLTGTSHW